MASLRRFVQGVRMNSISPGWSANQKLAKSGPEFYPMSDDWRLVIPVRQVKRRLLQLITLATLVGSLIINGSPFECAEFAGRMSL